MTKKELRRKQSELLVEHILNKDPISANSIFQKLIMEAEEEREEEVLAELDDSTDGSEDKEETEEIEELDDSTEEGGDEEFDSDDTESVEGLDSDETNKNVDDIIEINCQINAKMISNLFDQIAAIKNNIEGLNLDPNSREYLKYDVTIQYYSDKLQDLQSKTNPGIDQTKVEEALTKISTAIEQLKVEVGGSNEDDGDITDVETPEEVSAENDLTDVEETEDDGETDDESEEEETSEEELEEEPETEENDEETK